MAQARPFTVPLSGNQSTAPSTNGSGGLRFRESLTNALGYKRAVITSLPNQHVRYQRLRIAGMPEDELADAVYWRAKQELGWESHEIRTDFYDVGEIVDHGKRRREVIVVVASDADIQSHVDRLHAIGMYPNVIETNAGALARCLSIPRESRAQSPHVIVEFSGTESTLIIAHERAPRYVHSMPRSPECNLNADTSRCAHEINLCLHYLNEAGHDVGQAQSGCVVGAGANEQDILEILNLCTEVTFHPLETCLPLEIDSLRRAIVSGESIEEWLVPFGLALYGHESRLLEEAA